jgi:hypothetical protein
MQELFINNLKHNKKMACKTTKKGGKGKGTKKRLLILCADNSWRN